MNDSDETAKIAFYAPMKPPFHETPSGDRKVARLFFSALERAGFRVELASDFRSYDGAGDADRQSRLQQAGRREAARLIACYEPLPRHERPAVWFTYHLYHKSPDWLGPAVAAALDIPYVVAEASRAPKQAGGPWDIGYRGAEDAIEAADLLLPLTRLDSICLGDVVPEAQKLSYFPPFLDAQPYIAGRACSAAHRRSLAEQYGVSDAVPWLLTVAMMRPGDKLASYRILFAALARLREREWRLWLVGDGGAEAEIAALAAPFGDWVIMTGRLAEDLTAKFYGASDIYVWPAVNEAFGVSLLEAQAAGLPIVAGYEGGVPDVTEPGQSALLTAPRDVAEFAQAMARLLDDQGLRQSMGKQAQAYILGARELDRAAENLSRLITPLLR